jgi:hypothetical protein
MDNGSPNQRTRPTPSWLIVWLLGALLWPFADASAQWTNPKAEHAPTAEPQNRAGGEGIPPLPLPATPVRRTERHRPPAPPALVGMIDFDAPGQDAFPTTAIDIEALMRQANQRLGIQYRFVPTSLETFSWDPTELPLLYLTGWTEIPPLSDAILEHLRQYLYEGGTLVVHAQCGRQAFVDSARRELRRILPNRPLAPIDGDSPLYNTFFRIRQMRFRRNDEEFETIPPYLEGIYLGARPAIIFSPIDLNCGWDIVNNPIEGGVLYQQDDARRLGVNIISMVLTNFRYAQSWGTERVFPEQLEPTRDQLVIAQIAHDGDWDPAPQAMINLMRYVLAHTTIRVQFRRDIVDLDDESLYDYPVLMITGLRDFTLSDEQVARLRHYLESGGTLLADAAGGRRAFDVAFRREIARILPDAPLTPIAPNDPIYDMPFPILSVTYTPWHALEHGLQTAPSLEGVQLDGQWRVIYSAADLSTAWEATGYAYARGHETDDALRLGVNMLTYALSH